MLGVGPGLRCRKGPEACGRRAQGSSYSGSSCRPWAAGKTTTPPVPNDASADIAVHGTAEATNDVEGEPATHLKLRKSRSRPLLMRLDEWREKMTMRARRRLLCSGRIALLRQREGGAPTHGPLLAHRDVRAPRRQPLGVSHRRAAQDPRPAGESALRAPLASVEGNTRFALRTREGHHTRRAT